MVNNMREDVFDSRCNYSGHNFRVNVHKKHGRQFSNKERPLPFFSTSVTIACFWELIAVGKNFIYTFKKAVTYYWPNLSTKFNRNSVIHRCSVVLEGV